MEAIDFVNDWDDKDIEILDEQGNEYKAPAEVIENELMESNLLDFQDEDLIQSWGFQFWCGECRDHAKDYLNELFEFNPDLKAHFKPI